MHATSRTTAHTKFNIMVMNGRPALNLDARMGPFLLIHLQSALDTSISDGTRI